MTKRKYFLGIALTRKALSNAEYFLREAKGHSFCLELKDWMRATEYPDRIGKLIAHVEEVLLQLETDCDRDYPLETSPDNTPPGSSAPPTGG